MSHDMEIQPSWSMCTMYQNYLFTYIILINIGLQTTGPTNM
jgi:hypothetical protein